MAPFGAIRYCFFWAPLSENSTKVGAGNERNFVVDIKDVVRSLINLTGVFPCDSNTSPKCQNSHTAVYGTFLIGSSL